MPLLPVEVLLCTRLYNDKHSLGIGLRSMLSVIWTCPADCSRGEVVQFQDFTFGWYTMQVTEPAQSTLRQGDRDGTLFSLLSDGEWMFNQLHSVDVALSRAYMLSYHNNVMFLVNI